jgi:GGDEF domain-containing protein
MSVAWRSELESLLETELRDGRPDSPFRPALLRWAAASGRDADPDPVLDHLEGIASGDRAARAFRSMLPVGRWIPLERRSRWRPLEAELAERHPNDHANRLWRPPILVEHLAWLEELAAGPDRRVAARAQTVLDAMRPVVEDVVAQTVAGADAWGDTFLLWSFARRPRALEPVLGLVTALATRYVLRASRTKGIVHGQAFPFFGSPMTSATVHLAAASAIVGEGLGWVDEQLAYLRRERRHGGGWGDPRQDADLLTTLAAARLLGSLDPSFEPGGVVETLAGLAARAGPRPAAIGPEWPWIAVELLAYEDWSRRSFTDRFQWPNVPPSAFDGRVGVPRLEGYFAVADLFTAVPALGGGLVDVVFLDLANFGHWNSLYGQDAGDRLLELLTAELRTLPRSRTYRDGGDEFLVLGAPGTDELEANLRRLCAGWPEASRRAFPGLPVVPIRAVISRERASHLRKARERQGVDIGVLKQDHPTPPDEGIVRRSGD